MTHLSGFSDALFYISLFALFIPLANILLIPLFAALIHKGFLEQTVWRVVLIVNGLFSLVPSWFFFGVVLIKYAQNSSATFNLLNFAQHGLPYIGYIWQTIFVMVWMVFFLWRKKLNVRFYKAWGWCFALFYFLPSLVFLTFVTVSFMQRSSGP